MANKCIGPAVGIVVVVAADTTGRVSERIKDIEDIVVVQERHLIEINELLIFSQKFR